MPVAEVVGALLRPWVSQSIRTEAACVLNRMEQDVGQKRKTCTPKATKARPRSCVRAWDGGRGERGTRGSAIGWQRLGVGERRLGCVWECAVGVQRAHYMSGQRKQKRAGPTVCSDK